MSIDLLLINTQVGKELFNLNALDMPNIGIAYLQAIAKKHNIKSRIINLVTEKVDIQMLLDIIKKEQPLLIGFTAFTEQIKTSAKIADYIKNMFPHIKICVGGSHASAMPIETLIEFPSFDFSVKGEAEISLPAVFENLNNPGVVPGIYTRESKHVLNPRITNLDDLPLPAWEDFADLEKYTGGDPHRTARELPMSTSRGCPYNCHFCARPFGRKRIHRSIDSVIYEMERNSKDFGAESIVFLDESFVVDKNWSEQLFRKMINTGISKKMKWSCETTVHMDDISFYRLMKEAGCYYIFYGFESANEDMLARVGKGVKTKWQIKKATDAAWEAGIITAGSFIFNLAGETEETANEIIEFSKLLYPKVYSLTYPIAVPFPGTEIREWAIQGKYGLKILSNDWDEYGKQKRGVMESKTMNLETLQKYQKTAYDSAPIKNLDTFEKMMNNKKMYK